MPIWELKQLLFRKKIDLLFLENGPVCPPSSFSLLQQTLDCHSLSINDVKPILSNITHRMYLVYGNFSPHLSYVTWLRIQDNENKGGSKLQLQRKFRKRLFCVTWEAKYLLSCINHWLHTYDFCWLKQLLKKVKSNNFFNCWILIMKSLTCLNMILRAHLKDWNVIKSYFTSKKILSVKFQMKSAKKYLSFLENKARKKLFSNFCFYAIHTTSTY